MTAAAVATGSHEATLAAARLARLRRLARLQRAYRKAQREAHRGRLEHYAHHPAAWVADTIDWPGTKGPAPYQLAALEDLAEAHRLALRGPRGLGKTTTAALAVLWFALTRDALGWDWKILTTAGVGRHLSTALWPEIHKWARRIRTTDLYAPPVPDRQLLKMTLSLDHGQAFGAVARDPDMIESAHADQMLILVDEGKSVRDPIWDALEGSLTGEGGQYALALSTPGAPAGRFYEIHAGRLPEWRARHVTADEAIAAGRISRSWLESRRRAWTAESALFRQQGLGEFAADDEGAVVPLSWVEAAFARWEAWREDGRPELDGARSYSVDVATTGADQTVIATRVGRHVTRFEQVSSGSTMDTVARVQRVVGSHLERPVVVDVSGVGSGVADRLTELGYAVMRYVGAAGTKATSADDDYGFVNVRSAAYWRLRELLSPDVPEAEQIMLPPHQHLIADLTTPTWRERTGMPSKIAMETKEQVVARLGRSPDHGDAVAMAYWLDAMHSQVGMASSSPSRALPRRPLSPLGK